MLLTKTSKLRLLFFIFPFIIFLFGIGCVNKLHLIDRKLPPCNKNIPKKNISSWSISGKIAGNNSVENWTASFIWHQNKEDFDLILVPTMSSQHIKITSHSGITKILFPKETITTNNIDQTLKERLNWSIPLTNIVYWIKALPKPNMSYKARKNANKLTETITQDGWQINFKSYHNYKYHSLPKKLFITKHPFNLRVIIYKWQNINNCTPT